MDVFSATTPRHFDIPRARLCQPPFGRVISVVTSGMVNDHLLRHGEVIVQGDTVKARHVANQLALQAAVAQQVSGLRLFDSCSFRYSSH